MSTLLENMTAFKAIDLHVQVELQNLPAHYHRPHGMLHVSANVIRIFKAPEQLKIGSGLEFDLPVYTGEEGDFPDGGLYFWYEDLRGHPYLEVCLNGNPPLCQLAEDLYQIIPGPTEMPVIHFEQNSEVVEETKKWWKLW